jgi:hypothetical protein
VLPLNNFWQSAANRASMGALVTGAEQSSPAGEHLNWIALFDDDTVVHEYKSVPDFTREGHLVGDDHDCHPVSR